MRFTFQSGYIQIKSRLTIINLLFILYIPIWLYSNLNGEKIELTCIPLYIPIWLYSNCPSIQCIKARLYFTFQSGYIQIIICLSVAAINIIFTFQSGYIQIILNWA